jgi:hypothetical protein
MWVPSVPVYRKTPYPVVTFAGTKQWLNPDAFVSVVDPTTGDCTGTTQNSPDNPAICQFGNSGRNSVRGPHYTNSDIYITKTLPIREGISFRFDAQMFNAFNHANFALPSERGRSTAAGSEGARRRRIASKTVRSDDERKRKLVDSGLPQCSCIPTSAGSVNRMRFVPVIANWSTTKQGTDGGLLFICGAVCERSLDKSTNSRDRGSSIGNSTSRTTSRSGRS